MQLSHRKHNPLTKNMKHFAVIGNPIAHSKSPEIHAEFAVQCHIELNYSKLLSEPTAFQQTAEDFFVYGLGANVTVPFKEEALQFAAKLGKEAAAAGAVNTLSKKDNLIIGDNTDGIGLVRDIRDNHHCDFYNKNVLIIGAGGAARGVILPIIQEQPQSITIVNRTPEKAQRLAEQFAANHSAITAMSFAALNQTQPPFDIVINATSASLSGAALSISPNIFSRQTVAYDMMYGAAPTPFMQLAQQQSATAIDGLGMLVEQAAKSFEIWHGVQPKTQNVIQNIRRQLQK